MILQSSRRLWALALGLAVAGLAAGRADAAPIQYSTFGNVNTPSGGTQNLVYFDGINGQSVAPPDNIDLGRFVVSSLASTTNATYKDTPFQIVASAGVDRSEVINGVLNGMIGPGAASPSLTATITGISPLGKALPFALNLPLNTPMNLSLASSSGPAQTSLTAVAAVLASPVPEPTSMAVFTVALGGLGLWRRRAAR